MIQIKNLTLRRGVKVVLKDATVTLNKEVFADIGIPDEDSRTLAAAIDTLRHNSGDF